MVSRRARAARQPPASTPTQSRTSSTTSAAGLPRGTEVADRRPTLDIDCESRVFYAARHTCSTSSNVMQSVSVGDISMRFKPTSLVIAVFAICVGVAPAVAHHGFSVEFDGSKCMDLKGTLTGLDWDNPHAYVHMDVKDADGK